MVYDLGGGTLDVTVLCIENEGEFEVLSTFGDTYLGGQDFTNELVKYCTLKFEESTGLNIRNEKRPMDRLRQQCEMVKKMLSVGFETHVDIEEFHDGKDLRVKFTRALFENITGKLFDRCVAPIDNAVNDSKLSKD